MCSSARRLTLTLTLAERASVLHSVRFFPPSSLLRGASSIPHPCDAGAASTLNGRRHADWFARREARGQRQHDGAEGTLSDVAMDTNPLSEAQTARLLAAECYRLKYEHSRLSDEICILRKLRDAEVRMYAASNPWPITLLRPSFLSFKARYDELWNLLGEANDKRYEVFRKLTKLRELSQASLSLLCGDTGHDSIERLEITDALEPQEFKDGAVLIKQGEPRNAFFIIVQGELSCTPRRDRRCEVGLKLARLRRPSGAPQRPGTPGAPRLRPARARLEQERHHKGPWRLAASSAAICATQAVDLANLPRRPGLDEGVVERDCLLTNEPCESTV